MSACQWWGRPKSWEILICETLVPRGAEGFSDASNLCFSGFHFPLDLSVFLCMETPTPSPHSPQARLKSQPCSQAPPPTEQAFLCSKNTVTLSYWYSYRLSPNPYSLATYLASSKNDPVVVWWSIFFHFFWFFPSNAHSHRTKILISPKIVPVFLGKTR